MFERQSLIPLLNPYLDLYTLLKNEQPQLQLSIRKKLIWAYSWAIPDTETIQRMAQHHSPFIELGAGTGYWAWLLEQAGAKVIAMDQESNQPPHWHPVRPGDASEVSEYQGHTLFLCWPPLGTAMALEALQCYRGEKLIYVGEWEKRTADFHFHQRLKLGWVLEEKRRIPNWPGFSDQLYLFRRKSKAGQA
jgi:hypothetical protein